jgi:pilus assembly protein Flp/PilA
MAAAIRIRLINRRGASRYKIRKRPLTACGTYLALLRLNKWLRINAKFTMLEERSYEMSSILQFIKEEEGAEVVEVGIWLALIVAISIGIITTVGTKVKTAFTSVRDALP